MLNFKLPDYEVFIHIAYSAFGEKLEEEILSETAGYELEGSTLYKGVKDFHWQFANWDQAVEAGEKLKKFCPNPNLLLLKVKSNSDESIVPIIHKDLTKQN